MWGFGLFLIVTGIFLAIIFQFGLPLFFEYSANVQIEDPSEASSGKAGSTATGDASPSVAKKPSPFTTGALFRIGHHGALNGVKEQEAEKKKHEPPPRMYVRKLSLSFCNIMPGREEGIANVLTTIAHDHMFRMTHITMVGNKQLGSARVDIGMGLLLRGQLLARKTYAHWQREERGEAEEQEKKKQIEAAAAAAAALAAGEQIEEHHHHHHEHHKKDKKDAFHGVEEEEAFEFHDEEHRDFHDDMTARPSLRVACFDGWHINVGWSSVVDLHARRHITPPEMVLLCGVIAAAPQITELRLSGCPVCGPVWHDVGVMRRAHRSGAWEWEGIIALCAGLLTDPRTSLSRPLMKILAKKQHAIRKKTEDGYRGSVGTGKGEWGGLPRNTRIRIRWQTGGKVWYQGTVVDYKKDDFGVGLHTIQYDDGEELLVNMKRKEYRLLHEKVKSQESLAKQAKKRYDAETYDWGAEMNDPQDAIATKMSIDLTRVFVPAARLRVLDLSNTDIGGWNARKIQPRWDLTGWAMLCDAIKTNVSVVELHLGSNQLRPPHMTMLMCALRRNKRLEKLRLDHSRFVIPVKECYPTWFNGCTRARKLRETRYMEGRVPTANMLQTGHEPFIDEDMDESAVVELGALLQSAEFAAVSKLRELDLSFCDLDQGKMHLRGRYQELVQEWCDQAHVKVTMDQEDDKLAPMFAPKDAHKHQLSVHPFMVHGDAVEDEDGKKKKPSLLTGCFRKKNAAAVAAVGAAAAAGAVARRTSAG
jgi:hypothetical protein